MVLLIIIEILQLRDITKDTLHTIYTYRIDSVGPRGYGNGCIIFGLEISFGMLVLADIHAAAKEIAEINNIDISKIRDVLLEKWLCRNSQPSTDVSTSTFYCVEFFYAKSVYIFIYFFFW